MEKEFNPNDLSQPNGSYFALPYSLDECELVLISAPFDVTTSYRPGSAKGPDAIIDASSQVDLYDIEYKNIYEKGIATLPLSDDILTLSNNVRKSAEKVIQHLENGGSIEDKIISKSLCKVNAASAEVNSYVYNTAKEQLDNGKIVALVGGDHSTPLGLIKAVSERHGEIGILHIDAHADLREAFEGFTYSHASIMYNVINEIESVSSLVQVGVRDFCEDEINLIKSNEKITTFFDEHIAENRYCGVMWDTICDEIINRLPDKIYISFDIDGLHPAYCPSTGTPVPGGLEFNEAVYLIKKIARSGKIIVGFDVNEVSPNENSEWDANVGARLLYKLSLATLTTNNRK